MAMLRLFLFALSGCVHTVEPVALSPEPPPQPPEVVYDLRSLGPYIGFAPHGVDDARQLWFGALVYVPSEARLRDDPSARAEVILTPEDFGVGLAPATLVTYSQVTVEAPVRVPPATLSDPGTPLLAVATVPPVEGAVDAVWRLEGVNEIQRPEGANFNALAALSKLPTEDQARIAERLRADPGSVVIYVNRMDVARASSLRDASGAGPSAESQALNIAGPELLGWDFDAKACRLNAPEPWMAELTQMGMVSMGSEQAWTSSFGGKTAVVARGTTMEDFDVEKQRSAYYE